MELTSKQRAFLKSLAQKEESILSIGKSAVTPELSEAVTEALAARELIKLTVQKNCETDIKELAILLSERTGSTVVQIIGRKIVLYKAAKEPKIELPKRKKSV